MGQLTVQPILQIAHEDPVQYGHFLKEITHTHTQTTTKSGKFSVFSLRCIQFVSVSVSVGFQCSVHKRQEERNQDD